MKHIYNYELFLEETQTSNQTNQYSNQNTNQTSNKPKPKPNQKQSPADELLSRAEDEKNKIVAKKDIIEKGLLKNIKNLEPDNQKDVKTSVREFGDQVKEFDKTVNQIKTLDKTLKKSESDKPEKFKPHMAKAREQNKL